MVSSSWNNQPVRTPDEKRLDHMSQDWLIALIGFALALVGIAVAVAAIFLPRWLDRREQERPWKLLGEALKKQGRLEPVTDNRPPSIPPNAKRHPTLPIWGWWESDS
jgi:hypothetical protein